ncbi:hypothetical protein EUU23_10415 [Sphingorhabdus sp. IMCC26285]|uniref:Uncharacterized protein n=1 Tax=Sphingorhabdus profundilacus TaxID=2509718 RepID=A0A6I4M7N0_9SPHN|nr:hypothetical protein [Sphingorhabdus profundilacus]
MAIVQYRAYLPERPAYLENLCMRSAKIRLQKKIQVDVLRTQIESSTLATFDLQRWWAKYNIARSQPVLVEKIVTKFIFVPPLLQ